MLMGSLGACMPTPTTAAEARRFIRASLPLLPRGKGIGWPDGEDDRCPFWGGDA
jgi:hypothetical protein